MSLSTKLMVRLSAAASKAADLVNVEAPLVAVFEKALSSGTGSDQANLVWSEQYTITASGTQLIDLGGYTDNLGQSVVFQSVKAMFFKVATGGGDLQIEPDATGGFADWVKAAGDGVKVPAGGCFLLANPEGTGWITIAETDDEILLTETGGASAVTVDVVIIGTGIIS